MGLFGKKVLKLEHGDFKDMRISPDTVVVRNGGNIHTIDRYMSNEGHQCFAHTFYSNEGKYNGAFMRDANTDTYIKNESFTNGDDRFSAAFLAKKNTEYTFAEQLPGGSYIRESSQTYVANDVTFKQVDAQFKPTGIRFEVDETGIHQLTPEKDAVKTFETGEAGKAEQPKQADMKFGGEIGKFMEADTASDLSKDDTQFGD